MRRRNYRYKKNRYKRQKKSSVLRGRGFWFFVLAAFFLAGLVYFLLFSPVFKLRQIGFSQTEGIDDAALEGLVRQELASRFLWVLPRDSYFLFWSSRVEERALTLFPVFKTVQAKKVFPSSLSIGAEKRSPFAVWCFANNQCFFIDQERVIFQKVAEQGAPQGDNLLLIFSDKEPPLLLAEACPKQEMEKITEIAAFLKSKLGIILESLTFQDENFLNVKTAQGWQIFFDLSLDLKLCLTKLQLLLEKEIAKEQLKTLEYVDLRFSKVYYK